MVKRLLVILACLALILGLVPALIGSTASDVSAPQAGTWTTYANGDNVVALAIDGHYLWAATNGGGVVRWDMTDGSYAQYLYPQSGLASNNVRAIAIDGAGRVWAGTDRGVSVFDGSTWTTYNADNSGLSSNYIQAIAIDGEGKIWVVTGGVSVFNGTTWTTYTFENTSQRGNQVTSVSEDAPIGSDEVSAHFASREEADAALSSGYVMFGTDPTFYEYLWYDPDADHIHISPGLKQDIPAGAPVYAVKVGLASNTVTAIAIDGAGNKWFGIPNKGLSVLWANGTWTTFSPDNSDCPRGSIDAIAVEESGRVWFSTSIVIPMVDYSCSVTVFDGATWTTYDFGWSQPPIIAIAIDGLGNKWFRSSGTGGMGWVRKFDGVTWTYYDDGVKGAIEADYGDVLATPYEYENGALWLVDPSTGKVWTAYGDGVSTFDGSDWTTYITAESGLASNYIHAIAIDGEGNKWFGTDPHYWHIGGGVSTFDGNTWTTYRAENSGLAYNNVQAIAIGSQGHKWFGVSDDGTLEEKVSKFDGTTWVTYPMIKAAIEADYDDILATLNENSMWTIEPPDKIWTTEGDGVSVFDGTTWVTYTLESTSQRGDQVAVVTEDAIAGRGSVSASFSSAVEANTALSPGYVMFGTDPTIYRYNDYFSGTISITPPLKQDAPAGTPVYAVRVGLISNYIQAIAIDGSGNKWFGSGYIRGGVSKFNGGTWTIYTHENTSQRGDQVTTVTSDAPAGVGAVSVNFSSKEEAEAALSSGYVMFGDDPTIYQCGSYFSDGSGILIMPLLRQAVSAGDPVYSVKVGLAPCPIYAIAIDEDDNVWFSFGGYGISGGGVSKFDGTSWTHYTTADGLVSNKVFVIAIDAQGRKWFGTDKGVNVFDGDTWTTYNRDNSGLVSNKINAIAIENSESIWFGTDAGVSKLALPPADFSISASPPFQSIAPGEAAQFEISLAAQGGFASPLTLGISGLPAHAEATFNPNPITPPASSTLSIFTSSQTPPGTYSLTIEANGGGISHTTTATVKVAPQYKLYLPFISRNYTLVTRLTYDPAQDWQPFFSPDGSQVAFCSNRAGNYDVHLMERGMWSPVNLTSSPGDEDVASFSPDGETIAFASDRSGDWEIYLMARDGSNVRNISQNPSSDDARPRFSPDGKWIAFDSNRDGNWEIYLMDASGGNVRRLTHHPARDRLPSFSPDGDWIVFRSERDGNSEVYVMDTDGENLRRLTDDPAFDGYPSFSPDGTRILFETDRDGNHEVYLMDVNGSNLVNLTGNPANDITPSFSPDGRWIIFASERDGNREIYLMPLAVGASGGAHRRWLGK